MKRIIIATVLLSIGCLGCQWSSKQFTAKPNATKFSINPLFSNNTVLQREMKVPVWGRGFSAVGYFFGRDLYKTLNVPIGLISTSWGGSRAEAWTRQDYLKSNPGLKPIMDNHDKKADAETYQLRLKTYKKRLAEWKNTRGIKGGYHVDISTKGIREHWEKPSLNDSGWESMKLPQFWEHKLKMDGVVWFRKTINIPKDWSNRKLSLFLAMIDDFDKSYFNGVQIGQTGEEQENAWKTKRVYTIPAELVKPGKAVIAVRVFDRLFAGGIHGKSDDMILKLVNSEKSIKLAGKWKYKIALNLPPGKRPRLPYGENHPHYPGALFNAMGFPLIPYGIKGVIWYQGEDNHRSAYQYRTLLPAMINCWRKTWEQGNFPFLIVELANFRKVAAKPGPSAWAELREAQNMIAAKLPACGVTSIIDLGEATNIHPKNKQDVGKRLQLAALKIAYGKNIVSSGPRYKSNQRKRKQ
jgi:sialate O-acetylesterase